MSVSLVVIRLEIADGVEVPDLAYEGKGYSSWLKGELARCETQNSAMNKTPPGGLKTEQQKQSPSESSASSSRGRSESKGDDDDNSYSAHVKRGMKRSQDEEKRLSLSLREGRSSPVAVQGNEDSLRDSGRLTPTSSDKNDKQCAPEKCLKTQLGKREYHPIQIETYKTEDASESAEASCEGAQGDRHLSKVSFFSGNPMVDRTNGLLHLYKRNSMVSVEDEVERSEMICMLAVPAKFTCSELMKFVAPVGEYLEHIRVIKDSTPNQYMVLLKFRSQKFADEFYRIFNGQKYNSLEEEVCSLVYVAKVEAMSSSEGASLPSTGLTELPTCPVCLERMDESVEGILTILCNHSFHGSCLVQWSDTTCPVCRYCQTPVPTAENKCSECDSCESLWICLICGHIGCGRYLECHAVRHYEQTLHTYAMELNSQRVWDYAGDNYVHRLAQNKADGKLVELEGSPEQYADDEKLDSLNLEYTYLLTSQLESQRLYFEEKISRIEKEHIEQMKTVEERSKKTLEEYQKAEHKFCTVEKERKNLEKKYTQVVTKVGALVHDLKEEKELNRCLTDNQALWQQKVQNLEDKLDITLTLKQKEINELKEQVTDLYRHLEAQQLIASTPSETQQEIQDGQILLGETSPSTSKEKTSHRPRRKK